MHRREFHTSVRHFFTKAVVNTHVTAFSSLELEHVDEHGGRAQDGGAPLLGHRPHRRLTHETGGRVTSIKVKTQYTLLVIVESGATYLFVSELNFFDRHWRPWGRRTRFWRRERVRRGVQW